VFGRVFLLGVAFALMLGEAAQASSSTDGTVTSLTVVPGGIAIFHENGVRSARPACSTEARWAINVNTAEGQAKFAALVAAYSAGKPVWVYGTGQCDLWADTETVNYFWVGAADA
jgi:hypothetical protein